MEAISWDEVRREARIIENELDVKMEVSPASPFQRELGRQVFQKKSSELDVEAGAGMPDHQSPSSSLCVEIGELLSKVCANFP